MRELGKVASRRKKPVGKILLFAFIALFLCLAAIKLFNLEKLFFRGPSTVIQLITNSGLKSDKGRVNVLLLGIGGAGHDGPNLSDTMILASIAKDGSDVAMISIPRDLWSPLTQTKINAVYAFGQEKDGQGLEETKKAVGYLFDLPVHYAARLDFKGFEKAIDLVGGIDVEVEKSFVDPKYPVPGKENDTCGFTIETQKVNGFEQTIVKDATTSATIIVTEQNDPFTCRYETLTFNKGQTKMDGETALKFVRSRHGTNDEGTDFARSSRQQRVILAFRQKALSVETLTSPKTILDLINTFGDSIDTDIDDEDVIHFAKLAKKIEGGALRNVVLDEGRDESFLIEGNPADYKGQYVLSPKNNSWGDLADYVQQQIFKLEDN